MYNYEASKARIEKILKSKTEIQRTEIVPKSDSYYTFESGVKSHVGAIFVDIVHSSDLFKNTSEVKARIMRAFCSEIIDILKDSPNYREIGIRGDCVYGIYSAPDTEVLFDLFYKACEINTFMYVLNVELKSKNISLKAGIGLGCGDDLIIKIGQYGSGINDIIWLGKAVTEAEKLGDIAHRNGVSPIAMSNLFHNAIYDILYERYPRHLKLIKAHYNEQLIIDFYQTSALLNNIKDIYLEKYREIE